MKHNRIAKLLTAGAVCAVAVTTVCAQTSTTTTSVGAGPVTAGVSTTTTGSALDGTGTITTYTPGSDYMMFRSEANAAPVRYYYSPKDTVVVDSEGHNVDWKYVRADMPVRYSYVKDGDRMVIRKITLTKPLSTYEKTETTTTTTTVKP